MDARCTRGVSSIAVTAALSVALLLSVAGMQLGKAFARPLPAQQQALEPVKMPAYLAIKDEDGNGTPDWQDELVRAGIFSTSSPPDASETATSSDPLSDIGAALAQSLISGYLSLAQYDAYTPERGEQLANTIAENLRAPVTFVPHAVDELSLDPDTSRSRISRYRTDVQLALQPLLTDEEYELTLFAAYIETNDPAWLDRLSKASKNYRAAEENLLAVRVPQDAAPEHLRLANALGAFAETLERMTRFAKDPFASIALLRTYNERERDLDLAFDALVKYYARTIGDN
ncbi:MAG TPA: hypothetical protein VNM40_04115 [Candidatus Paceibacterota bacterium]|nr:hypothetical protein [Candidatus Paceibacterota bacterium]